MWEFLITHQLTTSNFDNSSIPRPNACIELYSVPDLLLGVSMKYQCYKKSYIFIFNYIIWKIEKRNININALTEKLRHFHHWKKWSPYQYHPLYYSKTKVVTLHFRTLTNIKFMWNQKSPKFINFHQECLRCLFNLLIKN